MKIFNRDTVRVPAVRFEDLERKEIVHEILIRRAMEKLSDQEIELRRLRMELDNALAENVQLRSELETPAESGGYTPLAS